MQPHDAKPFAEALAGVFDALGGRAPGAAGCEVWFRTLRAHPLGDVVGALDDWVTRNNRPPTPSALADQLRDRGIDRREKQAEAWQAEEHNGPWTMRRTENGRRALAKIREMVAGMQRPGRGLQREWAHKIVDRYVDHDVRLTNAAVELACDALDLTREEREQLAVLREGNVVGAARAAAERAQIAAAENRRLAAIEAARMGRAA
jgi:hypothetical protein